MLSFGTHKSEKEGSESFLRAYLSHIWMDHASVILGGMRLQGHLMSAAVVVFVSTQNEEAQKHTKMNSIPE